MHHYQHSKISSIHKFIFKMQEILGFYELTIILLAFLNFYKDAKNRFIWSVYFWDTVNFRVPWPDKPHPFLTMPTQKFFDQLLIFVNLYQHAKKQFFHLFILEIQSILESRDQITHTNFWLCLTKTFLTNF